MNRLVLIPAISRGDFTPSPESQIPPLKHPKHKNIQKYIKFTPPQICDFPLEPGV